MTSLTVNKLTTQRLYMANCVDSLVTNNCASPLMCAINCASDGLIDISQTKIIPFNNYGAYYLRIKICLRKVYPQKLSRFSVVDAVSCNSLEDFNVW